MLHWFHSLSFMLYISNTLVPFSRNHRYFFQPLSISNALAPGSPGRGGWLRWLGLRSSLQLTLVVSLPPKATMDTRQSLDIFETFFLKTHHFGYLCYFFFGGGKGKTFWDLVLARFLSSKFNFFVGWRLGRVAISLSKSYHNLIQIWFVEVNQSVSAIEL